MKDIIKRALLSLAAAIFLQSCLLDIGDNKFTSFPLYLYNNSTKAGCIQDSTDITFIIKNIGNKNNEEVRIGVQAGDVKNATIAGNKDEFINVKLVNDADGSLILEKDIKVGKSVFVGGDKATRAITYCDNTAFTLTNFEN